MDNPFVLLAQQSWSDCQHKIVMSQESEQSDISDFLRSISTDERTNLFIYLAEHLPDKAPAWKSIGKYFPDSTQLSPYDEKRKQEIRALAAILLHSRLLRDKKTINGLALLLNPEQLAEVINTHPDNDSIIYQQLLTVLLIRARASPSLFQQVVFGNLKLANELMALHLQKQTDKAPLIENLLQNYTQFNWCDPHFVSLSSRYVIPFLLDCNEATLPKWVCLFFQAHHHNRAELCDFLDRFMRKENNVSLLCELIINNDDEAQSFCFHYLLNNSVNNPPLNAALFNLFTAENLVKLGPQILAIYQADEIEKFRRHLPDFCALIAKKLAANSPLWGELAEQLSQFPEHQATIDTLSSTLDTHLELKKVWIEALLQLPEYDKSQIFKPLYEIVSSQKTAISRQTLQILSPADLNAFYVYLKENRYNGTVLTSVESIITQDMSRLVALLLDYPEVDLNFKQEQFSNEALLQVLLASRFENTTHKLALLLCKRLYDRQNTIHQLIDFTQQTALAFYLMQNPECFALLCSRSTVAQNRTFHVLQGILVNNAATDLALRAVKLLNQFILSDAQMGIIALRFLAFFHQDPAQLQSSFVNLYDAESALTPTGKTNFIKLQEQCWQLLLSDKPFDATECKLLLCKQMHQPKRFAPVMTHIVLVHAHDSQLGAKYLHQLPDDMIAHLEASVLVTILMHSNEITLEDNWKKTVTFLASKNEEENNQLILALIAKLAEMETHTPTQKNLLEKVLHLPNFMVKSVQLSIPQLAMVLTHYNKDKVVDFLKHSIEARKERLSTNDLFTLCQSITNDGYVLEQIYDLNCLRDQLAGLLTLCLKSPAHNQHLLAMQSHYSSMPTQDQKNSLVSLLKAVQVRPFDSQILSIILLLIVSQDFHYENRLDRQFITEKMAFLRWDSSLEMLQFFLNICHHLCAEDARWFSLLMNSKDVVECLPALLQLLDQNTLKHHRFTNLYLTNSTSSIDKRLQEHAIWQNYLFQLLKNPPTLSNDQFALLFNQLNKPYQHQLAVERLSGSLLESESRCLLYRFANCLDMDELLKLAEQNRAPDLFVELIAQHHQSELSLSSKRYNRLLQMIIDKEQLRALLTNIPDDRSKFELVNRIFIFMEYDSAKVNNWLHQLAIDPYTLALFANFCIHEKAIRCLDETIRQDTILKVTLNGFLQQSDSDLIVRESSLLYHLFREYFLTYNTPWQCHATWQRQLNNKDHQDALQHQFTQLLNLHKLPDFFGLFESTEIEASAADLYAGARCLQLLPICGLAEAESSWQLHKEAQLLLSTASDLEPHHLGYFAQLQTLQQGCESNLQYLFSDTSQFRDGFDGKKPILTAAQEALLTQPLSFLNRQSGYKEKEAQFIEAIIQTPHFPTHIKLHEWLLRDVFLSPLAMLIDDKIQRKIIHNMPLDKLCLNFIRLLDESTHLQDAVAFLQKYCSRADVLSLSDEINTLEPEHAKMLLRFCLLAHLPHLSNLLLLLPNDPIALKLFLKKHYGQSFAIYWFKKEIQQLQQFSETFENRLFQLMSYVLGYSADNNNGYRLKMLQERFLPLKVKPLLIACINTFAPLLKIPTEATALYKLIQAVIESDCSDILEKLDRDLINSLLKHALQQPLANKELIIHMLRIRPEKTINALMIEESIEAFCLRNQILKDDKPIRKMDDLNASQFAQIALASIPVLLTLQNLLYYIQPHENLVAFRQQKHECALFCQEASFHATLRNLEDAMPTLSKDEQESFSQRMLTCLYYLQQSTAKKQYMGELTRLSLNTFNAVTYHQLLLLQFLDNKPDILLQGFAEYLQHNALTDPEDTYYLKQCLQNIVQKGFITQLCTIIKNDIPLDGDKMLWFLAELAHENLLNKEILPSILPISNWDWIQSHLHQTKQGYEWLEAIFQQEHLCDSITSSEDNRNDFLNWLQKTNPPANFIVRLLNKNTHSAIRSLLASHLLTRQDYIAKLEKSALPDLIVTNRNSLKHRLQALCNTVDLRQIPISFYSKLQAEACLGLLFTPRHFHLFSPKIMALLLEKITGNRQAIITAWLQQIYCLPNAYIPFTLMAQTDHLLIFEGLKGLDTQARHELLKTIIKFCEYIDSAKMERFSELCDESHLIYAIVLFLHGNANDKSGLADFIVHYLKGQQQLKKTLSKDTIHYLIRLGEMPAFNLHHSFLKEIVGDYMLDSDIFLNDCSLYYDDERIQVERMLIPLHHHTIDEKKGGTLNMVTTTFEKLVTLLPNRIARPLAPMIGRNVITDLARKFPHIPGINYFLIHYKGSSEQLQDSLLHYFHYFAQQPEDQRLALLPTIWLINNEAVSIISRDAIFNTLLHFPQLINGRIAKELLQHRTAQTLQKLYERLPFTYVQQICDAAVPLLKKYPKVVEIIEDVQKEAAFENKIAHLSGWFLRLRIYFYRCYYYGFHGFFQPNDPMYIRNFQPNVQIYSAPVLKVPENNDLLTLLEGIGESISLAQSIRIYKALQKYNLLTQPRDESIHRQQVDTCYQKMLAHSMWDNGLKQWLNTHSALFIDNRMKLLGLYHANNTVLAVNRILNEPTSSASLRQAFACSEVCNEIAEEPTDNHQPSISATLQKAGQLVFYGAQSFWDKVPTVPILTNWLGKNSVRTP